VTATGGKVTVAERTAERPDAKVSGAIDAWVSAFSPGGSRSALRISGDKELAGRLLQGLARTDGRSAGEAAA
jgi:hypothetical protein